MPIPTNSDGASSYAPLAISRRKTTTSTGQKMKGAHLRWTVCSVEILFMTGMPPYCACKGCPDVVPYRNKLTPSAAEAGITQVTKDVTEGLHRVSCPFWMSPRSVFRSRSHVVISITRPHPVVGDKSPAYAHRPRERSLIANAGVNDPDGAGARTRAQGDGSSTTLCAGQLRLGLLRRHSLCLLPGSSKTWAASTDNRLYVAT